ncbi:MAG: hypothetical protein ABSC29_02995 [Minisyncoccia bacterium]|jgi:hypothetical protein
MKGSEISPVSARERRSMGILSGFIENTAAELHAQGIPVGPDGRINMLAYKALYPEAGQDFAHTMEGQSNAEALRKEKEGDKGERLEILACALLQKYLGPKFIVARSAPFDDKRNGVDTIVFERETGNLVCAFDEVSETFGEIYQKKLDAVQERNLAGGATLKYGLRLEKQDGKTTIVPDGIDHVPLFYVALPEGLTEKGIREFTPSLSEHPDFEKKLFEYFIAAIGLQVKNLELYSDSGRLNPDLKKRLRDFGKVVNLLKQR